MRVILVLLSLIFLSFSLKEDNEPKQDSKYFEQMVREFKLVFFQSCISSSANNMCFAIFQSHDSSAMSDYPLGRNNYKIADALADEISQQITTDSISRSKRIPLDINEESLQALRSNGQLGKHAISGCLEYFMSSELDSIARINIEKMLHLKSK